MSLMARISSMSQKTDQVCETFTPAEILPAWSERDKDGMEWRMNDSNSSTMEAETRHGRVTLEDPEDRGLSHRRLLSGFEI